MKQLVKGIVFAAAALMLMQAPQAQAKVKVKKVTVKSNINVGAGKDFECYIKAPTVSGYTPVGIIGYDLVGNWDVWINVSSCYYNSGSNLIYTKGHNFGTGACNALLNAFVLYKKN